MQLWPAKEKAFAASFVAARSRSASAATTTGVELPSSSRTRLRAARSAMPQPTPLEPVKVIIRTRSSSTRTSPISAEGRERRLAGGLEHDRAARGEGGSQLVRDEVAREVEGRDRADDPDRPAEG